MNNINKIYQHAGKSDYQQNIKDIIDATIVSNPEAVTDNSTNVPMASTPVKKQSAGKSLCLFTNILDFKPKTAKRSIVDAKYKRRAMKVVTNQWGGKRKRHSKINELIKCNLCAWITCHHQVV